MQQVILILLAILVALLSFVVYFGYRSYRELKIEVNKNSLDLEALRTLVYRLLETDEKTNNKIAEFYKSPTGKKLAHFTNENNEDDDIEVLDDDDDDNETDDNETDDNETEDNETEDNETDDNETENNETDDNETEDNEEKEVNEEKENEEKENEEEEDEGEEKEDIVINSMKTDEETEDYPENIKKRGRAKNPSQSAKDFDVGQLVHFEGRDFEVYLAKNGVKRWRLRE